MNGIYRTAEGARAVQRRYREFLARWPVPAGQLTLPTREGDTFVVACGRPDAPPLVLLHGSMGNTTMWLADIPPWSAHFRVYAVDVIGEPGLSAPSRPPLGSAAYARWLDDVLDGLGVSGTSIAGVSLGGWLALDYATRRPERVARLALLCPGGLGRQRLRVPGAALLLAPFGRRGAAAVGRLALGAAPPTDTPEARAFADYLALIQAQFRPRRVALPRFGDEALRRLDMPVLAILGGRDAMLDSAGSRRRLEQAVPHATIRWLPDAGHLLLGQTGPVLDFLSDTDTR